MSRIAFIKMPAYGHVNPSLPPGARTDSARRAGGLLRFRGVSAAPGARRRDVPVLPGRSLTAHDIARATQSDDLLRVPGVILRAAQSLVCTKGEIALELLDQVRAEGLAHQAVVADAGYGLSVDFRHGLEERHERYVVGIAGKETVFSEPPVWAVGLRSSNRPLVGSRMR